jgi:hypothetical protein
MRSAVSAIFVACLAFSVGSEVRADDTSNAKALIEKAIKATGSLDKLVSTKGIVVKSKGKVNFQGTDLEITADVYVQPPDKQRTQSAADVNGMKFERIQILNGNKGWVTQQGNTEEMKEAEVEAVKEDLYVARLVTLVPLVKDSAFQLTALGEMKDGDHTLEGVKVSHKGHPDVSMYFDKATGLLARLQRKAKDVQSGSDVDQENSYSDFKEFDGVKRPTKLVVKRDGQPYLDLQITDYKVQDKLEDSLFEKPMQ